MEATSTTLTKSSPRTGSGTKDASNAGSARDFWTPGSLATGRTKMFTATLVTESVSDSKGKIDKNG